MAVQKIVGINTRKRSAEDITNLSRTEEDCSPPKCLICLSDAIESQNSEGEIQDTLKMAHLARQDQGNYEAEVSFGGESDLVLHWQKCDKNPGHLNFKYIENFTMQDLPAGYQTKEALGNIIVSGGLTVRLCVNYVSKDRPETYADGNPFPFYKFRGKNLNITGTGFVLCVSRIYKTHCPCTKCQISPAASLPWAKIMIHTAAHVVYNDEEAAKTYCHFYYDRKDMVITECPMAYGLKIDFKNAGYDWTILTCVTHDVALVHRLKEDFAHLSSIRGRTECDDGLFTSDSDDDDDDNFEENNTSNDSQDEANFEREDNLSDNDEAEEDDDDEHDEDKVTAENKICVYDEDAEEVCLSEQCSRELKLATNAIKIQNCTHKPHQAQRRNYYPVITTPTNHSPNAPDETLDSDTKHNTLNFNDKSTSCDCIRSPHEEKPPISQRTCGSDNIQLDISSTDDSPVKTSNIDVVGPYEEKPPISQRTCGSDNIQLDISSTDDSPVKNSNIDVVGPYEEKPPISQRTCGSDNIQLDISSTDDSPVKTNNIDVVGPYEEKPSISRRTYGSDNIQLDISSTDDSPVKTSNIDVVGPYEEKSSISRRTCGSDNIQHDISSIDDSPVKTNKIEVTGVKDDSHLSQPTTTSTTETADSFDETLRFYMTEHVRAVSGPDQNTANTNALEDFVMDGKQQPNVSSETCQDIVEDSGSSEKTPSRATVIISHPHGCSKMVSVGEWTNRETVLGSTVNVTCTKYLYTTPTCPGSSGAAVLFLDQHRPWCSNHTHSGAATQLGLNISATHL